MKNETAHFAAHPSIWVVHPWFVARCFWWCCWLLVSDVFEVSGLAFVGFWHVCGEKLIETWSVSKDVLLYWVSDKGCCVNQRERLCFGVLCLNMCHLIKQQPVGFPLSILLVSAIDIRRRRSLYGALLLPPNHWCVRRGDFESWSKSHIRCTANGCWVQASTR